MPRRRRSELVARDILDVTSGDAGPKVLVRPSKGDQEKRGQEVGIHRSSDPQLCPARALDAWLAIRGQDPGPLFL